MSSKELILQKKIIPFFYSLIHSFLHVVIMIAMMSMNGYVILAIIIGYTSGFALFYKPLDKKVKGDCHGTCSKWLLIVINIVTIIK